MAVEELAFNAGLNIYQIGSVRTRRNVVPVVTDLQLLGQEITIGGIMSQSPIHKSLVTGLALSMKP